MKKTFVLDTNVILHSHQALFSFQENDVVIPLGVMEELDRFKGMSDERGREARQASRELDRLRAEGVAGDVVVNGKACQFQGVLANGVMLPKGGTLRVLIDGDVESVSAFGLDPNKVDNRILACGLALKKQGCHVVLISKDINCRIKADALGLSAEDFETNKVNIDELYTGWREISITEKKMSSYVEKGYLAYKTTELLDNEYVVMRIADNKKATKTKTKAKKQVEIGRYSAYERGIVPLSSSDAVPWGVAALNIQQKFAIDMLLDDSIQLVSLVGNAGTGKTLLALACGLQKTMDEHVYRKLLISRPIMPLGKDIGYLPGSKDDKLSHWMQPIFDNLEFVIDKLYQNPDDIDKKMRFLLESQKVQIEAITYIRGRSIPKQYLIVDEAQNLTPHEVKTIISRAGEGTKVVLTGDPHQIDNPYLDSSSNGLNFLIEKFKGQSLFGHIILNKSERSELSALASSLL